jgi:hypothetical protein
MFSRTTSQAAYPLQLRQQTFEWIHGRRSFQSSLKHITKSIPLPIFDRAQQNYPFNGVYWPELYLKTQLVRAVNTLRLGYKNHSVNAV